MKRRLLGVALLGAAALFTVGEAQGFGGRKKNDCAPTTSCGTPCGSYVTTYVDKKVTVNEWVTTKEEYKYWVSEPVKKKEKVKVKEAAWKDETFKYTVNELVTAKEKVKVKEMAWKDESFKYTVNELVTAKEKVKVAESKAVTKDVEFTSYTLTPVVTKQKRTVCEWVCVPVTVTCAAPVPAPTYDAGRPKLFHRLCGKKNECAPPCPAPCATPCEAPCPPPVITKTVMQRQMVTREVEVDVTTYTRTEKKEKKPVTTYETVWVEKEVNVTKCVPVEKTGTRKVCHWVDVEKEIDVTTYNKVEKTGTRNVAKCVPVEKVVKVAVCTFVPAPAPAPAPCATPCASPCETPCIPTGMTGGCGTPAKGGLFKGKLCGGK
ncbi:MAG TPA: hypothetical protein VGE74_10970 [Gemmata sp.]